MGAPDVALSGRVVVITGASAGIGAALAHAVSARGAKVVLAARRERELADVAKGCGAPDGDVLTVVTDVTKRVDVQRLFDKAHERFGAVDAWVNNAGRGISRPVSQLTDEDFDEMMLVNVKSALYGMQAVLPHMKARKRGHIINISSMLSRVPFVIARAAYSASKHALNALTTNLRMELRAEFPDIMVTNVMPGVVATDFGKNAKHGGVESRSFPNAQPADDVAKMIADCIERPCAELYTQPQFRAMVAGYYAAEDLLVVESKPPFAR